MESMDGETPRPMSPQPAMGPGPGPQSGPRPAPQQGLRPGPAQPPHGPLPQQQVHVPPRTPTEPWWNDEKLVLKVTAAVGALITVSGIILLVAFAIQSGLLGPLGRVILAYSLAVVLAVAAVVVHRKNPGNAGVTASGAAAVITSHITTAVLVHGLEWWTNWLGTVVVLAVMGLGFLGARAWKSVAFLMVGFVVSFIAASITVWPRMNDAFDVIVLVLVPSVAAAWTWHDREHRGVVSMSAVVLYLIGSIGVLGTAEPGWLAVAAFIAAGVALAVREFLDDDVIEGMEVTAGVDAAQRERSAPEQWALIMPVPGAAERRGLGLLPLYFLAWTTAPLLSALGPGPTFAPTVALVLGLAIGVAGFGPWKDRTDPRMNAVRWAGFISAAWPALHLGSMDSDGSWTRMPALILAAAFIWIHVFRPSQLGKVLIVLWTAVALVTNTAALVLTMFAPSYLLEHRFRIDALDVPNVTLSALLIGVMALGLIAVLVARRDRAEMFEKGAALLGLLLTAVPVIIVLTTAGVRFSLAHVLVSIGWMIAAAWMMLAPKRLNVDANMAASLVIATVAVLKLVFYDMQAMSGLTRVSAFLLCGLLMLGMVVARSLRDRNADLAEAKETKKTSEATAAAGRAPATADGHTDAGETPDDWGRPSPS